MQRVLRPQETVFPRVWTIGLGIQTTGILGHEQGAGLVVHSYAEATVIPGLPVDLIPEAGQHQFFSISHFGMEAITFGLFIAHFINRFVLISER